MNRKFYLMIQGRITACGSLNQLLDRAGAMDDNVVKEGRHYIIYTGDKIFAEIHPL